MNGRTCRAAIDSLEVAVYEIPTEQPESDGTHEWDRTTVMVVHACGAGITGLGYTYGSAAAARVVEDLLAPVVIGRNALDVAGAWLAMVRSLRNAGREGIGAAAVSAVDTALWDLKARLFDVPLCVALDAVTEAVPLYGSGGFTSYDLATLEAQLAGWAEDGIASVKMKVGRAAERDPERVRAARKAIGDDVDLMVDANGAYRVPQAIDLADRFAVDGVVWFEEPVSSDDLRGLRAVRERAPAGMAIAAGEYGWDPWYYDRLLAAHAVDAAQIDVTRVGGFTGFALAAGRCAAAHVPVSIHCAPQLGAHAAVAATGIRHLEWFHDHVRVERLLFDGALEPVRGSLVPDRARAGHGLTLKTADAAPFRRDR